MLLPLIAVTLMAQSTVPSKRQLAWHGLEYYAFVHFGLNTFTDKEWGEGKEDPALFNPTALDCRQWCRLFKAASMKGVIITAKHHDGFCLWPSRYSTHTVAQSPWKGGKGDVLMELSKACKAEGLKMGVYLSPWDRNHPAYGTPEYNKVFASMLKEVLTKYGPIFEVWFDGAHGEGPNGKRQVYDWNLFISTVRKYQPNACIFSDAGPDVRWVGNEDGYAGETSWYTMDKTGVVIGAADQKYLNVGDPNGHDWVPPECDVSIRPGWFYHASQDSQVKPVEKLLDIWHASVGRGANLLLNVPPDRRGLIHENDAASLMALRHSLDKMYRKNWAIRSYWDKGYSVIDLDNIHPVDRVVLGEEIRLGQHISSFTISADVDGKWQQIAKGTTIGRKRIVTFPPIRARALRLLAPSARPARIKTFEAYGPDEE